jgi:biotin/methionine sulfoxide reductase
VAVVDSTVSEGVVVLPTGGWFTPYGKDGLDIAGNPNVLTPDLPSSRFGQGCSAYTCLVSVEPFREKIQIPDAMSHYQRGIEQRCRS